MPLQSPIFPALYPLFWHEIDKGAAKGQSSGEKNLCSRPSSLLWDIIFPADIPDFPLPKKIALPKSSFDPIFTYFLLAQYSKENSIFLFAKNKRYSKNYLAEDRMSMWKTILGNNIY